MIRTVGAVLGVVLLAAFAVPILRRPGRTILPLFAASLPIASVVRLPDPLPSPFDTLSSLLGGLAILGGAIHVLATRRFRLPTWPMALWCLFFGWIFLTVFWAVDTKRAFESLNVAIPLLVLLFVVSCMKFDDTDLAVWRVAIIGGGIVVGLYAAALLLRGAALPSHGASFRFSLATTPQDTDPNILAASLLLPLVLSAECLILGGSRWWAPKTWRLIGAAGVLFVLIAMLLTGSRGGAAAAAAALIYTVLLCRRVPEGARVIRRAARTVGGAVIGLVVVGAVLLLAGVKVPGLGRLHTVERLTGTTSSGRAEIWKTGLVACTLHCATGSGLGTFEFAYNESFALTSTAHNAGFNRPAHDIYLSLAVETGFLGLTLFLLAVLGEWAHFGRRALFQLSPGFRATIAGVLLANIFLSAIWFKYFWLPFVFGRVIEGAAASLQRDSGLEPVDQRSGDRLPMLTRPAKTR